MRQKGSGADDVPKALTEKRMEEAREISRDEQSGNKMTRESPRSFRRVGVIAGHSRRLTPQFGTLDYEQAKKQDHFCHEPLEMKGWSG